MKEEPICPYCKAPLVKFPSRKTKCKNCENPIYVVENNLIKETHLPFWKGKRALINHPQYFIKKEIENLKNTDDIWRLLNRKLAEFPGFEAKSDMYFLMSMICDYEGNHLALLQTALTASHFKTMQVVEDERKWNEKYGTVENDEHEMWSYLEDSQESFYELNIPIEIRKKIIALSIDRTLDIESKIKQFRDLVNPFIKN